ncbi:MAG: hypothetical protein LBU05_01405, partial [Bifidobacteriaceae bacterium]|nr:hypothetical protein [Bifidobacteriaceae bacterium]
MDQEAVAAGFVRVAACSSPVHLADPPANAAAIAEQARAAARAGASLAVFPELSVTGYSLDDLFMQSTLLQAAEAALADLAQATADLSTALVVGAPLRLTHRLYNCAVVIAAGRILGAVPKSYLPNYREFYEHRQFASGIGADGLVAVAGQPVRLTAKQLFDIVLPADAVHPLSDSPSTHSPPASPIVPFPALAQTAAAGQPAALDIPPSRSAVPGPAAAYPALGLAAPAFRLGIEICEDLWVPISPSAEAALAGAEVIANISGSPITVAKARERRRLSEVQSAKLISGYIYAASG